jgi:protein-L-isoaspartate(D-aspartate) O-methyltransferase
MLPVATSHEGRVLDESGRDAGSENPAALQRHLVDRMVGDGVIRSGPVGAAFRAVPRHLFLPGVPVGKVYSDTSIATKMEGEQTLSSSSQPSMMAIMLEQLELQPGQHVLEIGAGTGYNAALLAHMVGERGHVVTVDIDVDIVDAARMHLAQAGYDRVTVICADGGAGYLPAAPYDRIMVTVGADDVPPAWHDQLRPGGRLVVPLGVTALDIFSGHKLLAAFDRLDGGLESRQLAHCRFVPLRGAFGAQVSSPLMLNLEAGIRLVTANPHVDGGGLGAALAGPHHDHELGMVIRSDEMHGLRLWIALHEPEFCDLLTHEAHDAHTLMVTSGICRGSTLAMLSSAQGLPSALDKPVYPSTRHALQVRRFGPDEEPGRRLAAQIIAWDHASRPFCHESGDVMGGVLLRALPLHVPYSPGPHEAMVEKRSTRLVFRWG